MLDPAAAAAVLARALLETGAKGVDEVNQEIQALELSLTRLGTAYEQGRIKITDYANESERLRVQIGLLKTGLAAAQAAVAQQANPSIRFDGQASLSFGFLSRGSADPASSATTRSQEEAADREADRLAHALESSVGKSLLEATEGGQKALRPSVAKALSQAGVSAQELDELTTRVADKLWAWSDAAIKARKLPREDTNIEAKVGGIENASEPKAEPASGARSSSRSGHSQSLSDQEYLERMLVAGFSRPLDHDPIPGRQLDEQRTMNKKLDRLTKAVLDQNRAGDVARFARGRT